MANPFNFVWITDTHRPDATPADQFFTLFGLNEFRRYSTWQARIEAMLTTANDLNTGGTPISLVIQTGDFTDSGNTDATQTLIDGVAVVNAGDWAGPYLDTIGNHEQTSFTGNWAANYFANLLGRTANDHEWTDNDDESDGVAGKAYSVDIDGFHIIVLYAQFSTHTMTTGQKDWLAADLVAHAMPTIVFSHAWISGQFPAPSTSDWVNISNDGEVRAILETATTVRAVFQGQFHQAHAPVLINDIWYFHSWGSVHAPEVGDNAYSLVKIIPDAAKGTNQNQANIEITGYGLQDSKSYEKYLIGV